MPDQLKPKTMPLEAYLPTGRDLATLNYASWVLALDCMREKGYHLKVQLPRFDDFVAVYTSDQDSLRDSPFGLADRGAAAIYGYGEPPAPPNIDVDMRPVLDAAGPSAADAWDDGNGQLAKSVGSAGCWWGSMMRIQGQVKDVNLDEGWMAHKLQNDAVYRTMSRSDVQAVYGELGRCLRDHGYDVPDPEKPFASKKIQALTAGSVERDAGEPAPPGEVKLALTDVDCKIKIDMVRRLDKIKAQVEDQIIEANALALQEDRKKLDAALKRAADVLAGKDIK